MFMSTVISKKDQLTWRPKKALRLVPIEEQFSSPIVARHMAEIAKANEELRQWRKSRMGKRIVRKEVKLIWR
jgi:hypothetical protein